MAFSWIDLAVVIVYLAAVTLLGARFGKRQHTLHDYFLGGRQLPWWAIALSVVSAETSILTIISTPGIAFATDMGFLQLVFGYLVARVVVSFVLIPKYFAGELFTAYQLIERRFGRTLKMFTAGLFLSSRALAEGVRVFAISIVIEVIFKTGVLPAVLIITSLTLFYTFEGGLTAVIWTDVVQLTIYLVGTVVALFLAVHAIPGGWPQIAHLASVSGSKFAIFDFHFNWHQPYLFWSGLIGGTFLTSASHGTDQLIVQRLLAAKNKRQSQGALLTSGLVILFQFALFLVMGVVLFSFYHYFPPAHPFSRPDKIYPTFVVTNLPVGLAGLLTAAILAAAMANLSAAFNSLASSSVVDFYRPLFRPDADQKHYLRVSRALTLFWGGILILIAIIAQHLHESVLELALTIASVPYGAMLGIFLLGVLTKRATSRGALTGALLGLSTLISIVVGKAFGIVDIAWTWYVVIGTLVTFAGGWVASRPRNFSESSRP
ncbi:MAG TPA: sodium:solute symporter [Terriglobia bacterium]|nr:sodium:solute symporter [Terriglobia bacterium]